MQIKNIAFLLLLSFLSCEKNTEPEVTQQPKVSISDSASFENASGSTLNFEISVSELSTESIDIAYTLVDGTAQAGEDFIALDGIATIEAGNFSTNISVDIIDDDHKEVDEKLKVHITESAGIEIIDGIGTGLIRDNDAAIVSEEGYNTAKEHYGYSLAWEEDFEAETLDESVYNFELGDGCPNLCGWGNGERQQYTALEKNIKIENSRLIITATEEGPGAYGSARIQTKGKKEFKFGRIDIRARLPKGQGIWPAIWMLGSNIDQAGWPVCGEIDLMELIGHKPKSSHGTAHWGAPGETNSTYSTGVYTINEDFNETFHVFSLVWEFNEMVWYVDETFFHKVTIGNMQGKPYPFNQGFFFVFNVAVGGGWPGDPDETTVFPQHMEIDYVRVFQ